MARNVNLTYTGWQATGSNVPVPQYEMTVTWDWTRDDGTLGTYTRLFRFPNDLQLLPTAYVAELFRELVITASRRHAGVED